LGVVACKNSSTGQITPQKDVITNQIYFAEKPIVSAHRAGKGIAGYPENCLQTIQYLSKKGIHSFEIDIFESTDGDLMLMHDDKLGRTATGQGVVSQMSTEALLKERLKDDFGKETDFQIPLLKDVLAWLKRDGKGYQTRINAILREAMLRDLQQPAPSQATPSAAQGERADANV